MGTATIYVAIEIEGDEDAANHSAKLIDGIPEIFQAVIAERHAQDRQWGGPEHDDLHEELDWEYLLRIHCDRLTDINGHAAGDYRQRLIKIAAWAVSAVQSWDRMPPSDEES